MQLTYCTVLFVLCQFVSLCRFRPKLSLDSYVQETGVHFAFMSMSPALPAVEDQLHDLAMQASSQHHQETDQSFYHRRMLSC